MSEVKEAAEYFFCNLKQDTFRAMGDQVTFWGVRFTLYMADATFVYSGWESFLLHHGWLILFLWRVFNAALDSYKRVRDVRKPEWKTQIRPLLIEEERRDRSLSTWTKIKRTFKSMF